VSRRQFTEAQLDLLVLQVALRALAAIVGTQLGLHRLRHGVKCLGSSFLGLVFACFLAQRLAVGMAAGGYIDQPASMNELPAPVRALVLLCQGGSANPAFKMRVFGGRGVPRLTIVRAESPDCEGDFCPTFVSAEGLPEMVHVLKADRIYQTDLFDVFYYYVTLFTHRGTYDRCQGALNRNSRDHTPKIGREDLEHLLRWHGPLTPSRVAPRPSPNAAPSRCRSGAGGQTEAQRGSLLVWFLVGT
jgi:hypothetical protein